ncbi:MAG: FGGY-family carbohydrate kinase [Treponema sp.]|jgi:sugar (pentulose or hexulose) kinase|nr:FGGY-family carbohydrate kinase [Treponema sp.]
MNKKELILTFDIGTQSARALMINAKGDVVHKAQKIYDQPYFSKQPSWAEQKPDFYWRCVCETSRSLKAKAGVDWENVIGVTCTTIRDSCLCLDKERRPLRDVILWLDGRRLKTVKPLPAPAAVFLKIAGMTASVNLLRKAAACNWLAENEPEIWAKTDKFVFVSTWLTYKFCGRLVDSTASVIGHIPFDVKNNAWMKSDDVRRVVFGVPDDKLFELANPCEVVGTITAKTAEETGVRQGLPFIAAGSDKGCETLGLSCLTPDAAALSFGTTATVQVTTRNYIEPLPHIPPYPAVAPGCFNPEVEIYRGYWLLSWFKREFAAKEVVEAQKLGVSAEKLLDERLRDVPPGCDGLVMQPFWTPGVSMPFAKGAVIGFSDVHTRIHLYRAIIEGINFALMEGLRSIERRGGIKVQRLFVAGGGSQSDEVCRITASMFGLTVCRIQTFEASSLGSAVAGFVSKGVFSSFEEGVASMVHIKDEFLPDEDAHNVYESIYGRVFAKMFDKLSPLYQELIDIGNRDLRASRPRK